MKEKIDLGLTVEIDLLRVTATNTGEHELRLWARNNSWGWSMFSLLLAPLGTDEWRELTAKPVRWTANIPHALELTVGGQLEYELRYQDPSWESLDDVNAWLIKSLQVQIRLRIIETAEAVAQNVFIGEALSASISSLPPHKWLFGG